MAPREWAAAVPTSTGTIGGRQRAGPGPQHPALDRARAPAATTAGAVGGHGGPRRPGPRRSRAAGEAAEVRGPVLLEGVAALLALLAHVEEHGGVAGELLESGQSVVGGVEPALQHPEGQG